MSEAGHLRRAGALARNRNFVLLWLGDGLQHRGSQAAAVAMPLLVLAVTGSPEKAGVVGVARTLAYPLTPLPAGALVRFVKPRTVMILCSLGRAVAMGSLLLTIALGRPSYLQLQVVAFASPAFWSLSQVAKRDLLRAIVPDPQLGDAAAVSRARESTAAVGAPLLGGILFQTAEILPFVAEAVEFVVALLCLLGLRVPADAPAAPSQTRLLRRGLAWQWRQPFLRVELLVFATANVTLAGVGLLVVLVARRHGDSARSIGVAFALIGIGALAGAALARVRRGRVSGRRSILVAPWAAVVLLPVLLVCRSALAIGVVVALMFLPMALASSALIGEGLDHTPEDLREPVKNSAQLVAGSISWLGPLAAGALFQDTGETMTILVTAAWALGVAVVATLLRGLKQGLPVAATVSSSEAAAEGNDHAR